MPAFQEYASWAVLFLASWGAVLAYFAFLAMERSIAATRLHKWLWGSWAMVLMVIAYNIHPTSATFIAVFITIFFFFKTSEKKFAHTLYFLIMSGLGAVAHFIIFKIYLFLLRTPALERAAFLDDPVEKLSWFITRPLLKTLNLIYLPADTTVAIIMAIMIGAGLVIHFIQQKQKKDMAVNFIFILLFILLSYSSNLIIDENLANYRTLLALTGVVTVMAIVAVQSFIALIGNATIRNYIQYGVFSFTTIACLIFAEAGYSRMLIAPVALNLEELQLSLANFNPEKHTGIIITFTSDREYKQALLRDYVIILKLTLFEKNPSSLGKIPVQIKPLGTPTSDTDYVVSMSSFTPIT